MTRSPLKAISDWLGMPWSCDDFVNMWIAVFTFPFWAPLAALLFLLLIE